MHAHQPPVSVLSGAQDVFIDPAAVVPDGQTQIARAVSDLHFDLGRGGMPKRIAQSLSADAIHLVARERVQGPCWSLHYNPEFHAAGRALVVNSRKSALQIIRANRGISQPSYGAPAVVGHLLYHRGDPVEGCAERRILGYPVDRYMKLHRRGEKPLQ